MKQNLLKYGLVIVLAMVASAKLLWADCCVEVVRDTCFVEKIDSLRFNLSVEQAVNTCCESDSPEEIVCWFERVLIFVKDYKKDVIFLFALIALIISGTISAIYRWCKKDTTSVVYKYCHQCLILIGLVAVCVFSDSSWFYLLLAAILLIYITKEDPDLLKRIREAMSALQGRTIPTDPATSKEIEDKRNEEVKETMPSIPTSPAPSPKEGNNSKPKNVGADGKTLAERIEARKNMHLSEIVRKAINAEDLIIQMLSKEYPNIETSRAIEVEGKRMVLDGFVQGAHENLIIEVKYMSTPMKVRNIAGLSDLLKIRDYVQTQSHKPTFVRIYVVTDNKAKKEEMVAMSTMPYVKSSLSTYMDIIIYTFKELESIISHKSIITTDFKAFMDAVNWEELNIKEKEALFEAAHGKINEKGIPFAVKAKGNRGIVELSYIGSDVVLLLEKAACKAFPKWLENTYMHGEDGYAYLSFLEAREKED